ncbi:MAG: hypothetical protein J7621_25415 [Niastella sp.]|nr:hypothetical protein [Niastella sp.]
MKKVCFVFAMLVFATGSLMAQGKVSTQDFHMKLSDGKNTVRVPNDQGSISFVKRGDRISDVVYTDAAGKTIRLAPTKPGTGGAPNTPCKYPLPDACYSIPNNQSVGMCICRPTDIKSDDYVVSIGLLLPAVQKVRDAATRN